MLGGSPVITGATTTTGPSGGSHSSVVQFVFAGDQVRDATPVAETVKSEGVASSGAYATIITSPPSADAPIGSLMPPTFTGAPLSAIPCRVQVVRYVSPFPFTPIVLAIEGPGSAGRMKRSRVSVSAELALITPLAESTSRNCPPSAVATDSSAPPSSGLGLSASG